MSHHLFDSRRIPFFFEPNFTANVTPLPAAERILKQKEKQTPPVKKYDPVVYGNFLLGKVSNNFAGGKGKYDD